MSNADAASHSNVEPHLWAGSYNPGGGSEMPFKENIFEFVERHNLTVVISRWNTSPEDADALEAQLREAKDRGIDVWLGTYDLRDHSDKDLLDDDQVLEEDIERLDRMVSTYAGYYPEGNVFVWHEAPLTGLWTGETPGEKADSIEKRGAEIFCAQKEVIAERHPGVDLGLMIHYPYVAPPSHTEKPIFGPLMSDLAELDALPDFTYFDFYRGYHEWDGGYEATNDFLDSIVRNVREHTGDRPIYYLGESHSINNHYTPSKQSILGNLRTALQAGVDSYGWYIRKGFKETSDRNYNPFVPNVGDDPGAFNSVVGSRDRFVWAILALDEAVRDIDPSKQFDLWLYGHDFDFYEFDLSLRTAGGDWEFIGSFNGYLDGDNPYSGGGRDRVAAFHALDRDRYLDDNRLELSIEPSDDSDGATLEEVYVLPQLDTCHYQTECDATTLVEETERFSDYALGSARSTTELSTTEAVTATVQTGEPDASIEELVQPDRHDAIPSLAEFEGTDGFSPRNRFDLWVTGSDLEGLSLELSDTPIEEYRAGNGSEGAVVYRGLDRSRFFESHTGGHYLDLRVTGPSSIDSVFVMPYHGTANFTPDAEAAQIVSSDYAVGEGEGQLTTFSLGHQAWPRGVTIDAERDLETWVSIPHRKIVAGRSTPDY